MSSIPRLELRDITKSYPAVVANDGVSLRVMPGEIHAVLGENGAGKSTLMKIVYGVVQADAGEMLWNGRPVSVANPAAARRIGIGMVFQHFSLFETLTVAENIALAVEGPFDIAALSKRIVAVSERYGLTLDPGRLVHSLSVGERLPRTVAACSTSATSSRSYALSVTRRRSCATDVSPAPPIRPGSPQRDSRG
jgi:simple sugar transport system ATP-binding protein